METKISIISHSVTKEMTVALIMIYELVKGNEYFKK